MKKYFLGLAVVFVLSNCLYAQETKSKDEFGVYIKCGLSHDYQFKLNTTLANIGCKKTPDILTFGGLGFYYCIKKVEITLDGGVGGLYDKNTRLINWVANVSVGYKLTLPKDHSLIFSGNIAHTAYNIFTYVEKGNLDFENSTLTNSTMFHLELQQLMAGPRITWRHDMFDIGIGYDFGCIPFRLKSNNVNLSNSPKERIDRIYFDLKFIFLKH